MNEIEKLYENANAYKMLCNCEFKNLYDYRIEYGSDVCDYTDSKIKEPCKVCEKAKQKIKYYPDFTAEKQLELIKWLAIKGDFDYTVDIAKNTDAYWTIYFDDCRWTAEEFAEALAGLINQLWQDLIEEEKEQIRGILNGN